MRAAWAEVPERAQWIRTLFAELNRQGNTVLLVTHDPKIAAMASRRVELSDGLVVTPEEKAA